MSALPEAPRIQWPSLALAVGLMLMGTLYPPLMTARSGGVDHVLAILLLWAMSAGFVRGVGFVPRHRAAAWFPSGPACALAASAFVLVRLIY